VIAARIAAGDAVVPAVLAAKSLLSKLVAGGFPSAEGRPTLFAWPEGERAAQAAPPKIRRLSGEHGR